MIGGRLADADDLLRASGSFHALRKTDFLDLASQPFGAPDRFEERFLVSG